MAESIKVDQFLDLGWQSQQGRIHDIGQEPSQGLHVIARLAGWCGRHPLIFCRFDEVVNFGVDDLEDSLLGRFLVTSELFCSSQSNRAAGGILRPRSRQE